jgi:hypothetical protein
MRILSIAAVAAGLLAQLWTAQVRAEDACRPLRVLPAGAVMAIDRHSYELMPRLTARTVADFTLAQGALGPAEALFGPGQTSTELARAVLLPGAKIGGSILEGDRAELSFAQGRGHLVLARDGRRYAVEIRDQKAYAYGADQPLAVGPDLVSAAALILPAHLKLRLEQDGSMTIPKGSTLEWNLNDASTTSLVLQSSAMLEETNAQRSAARVVAIRPMKVLPGGELQVQLQASGIDFKANPPVFCFQRQDASVNEVGDVVGTQGELLSLVADVATFNVRVPQQLGVSGMFAARAFSVPLGLRILAYGEKSLQVDAYTKLALSSRLLAAVASLLVTVGVVLLSAIVLSDSKPLVLMQELAQHSGGRYSLSNIQICMWTMLVLYALCYVWLATGEILSISSGILILLGISGTTSVTSQTLEAMQAQPQISSGNGLRDLVSKDGSFDMMRFQMLGFTIFTWCYALVSVLRSEGLPEIPEHLYLLMGISNTTYVASKLPGVLTSTPAPAAPAATATTYPGEASPDADTVKRLQEQFKVTQSGLLDEATRAAIVSYKQQQGIIPATPRLDQLLLDKLVRKP